MSTLRKENLKVKMKIDPEKSETAKKILLELKKYAMDDGPEILAQILIKMCLCLRLDKGSFIKAISNLYDDLEKEANLMGELK